MLERLREGSQGLAAKIIIGAIILSFALFGVSNYLTGPGSQAAAVVNGEEITTQMLEQEFRNKRNQMQQQYGKALDQYMTDPQFVANLKRETLQSMINNSLLDQESATLGLRVGNGELVKVIHQLPYFQVDGAFNNAKYESLLKQNNMSKAQFREGLRQDLARQQLAQAVLGSDFGLPYEASLISTLREQQREMRFVSISAKKFETEIEINDEVISSYYDNNSPRYMTSEKVVVEYINLDINEISQNITIADEQVKEHYQNNIEQYEISDKPKVAQILININNDEKAAETKAQAALAKLTAGEEFAKVAKSDSEDLFSAANGGELSLYNPNAVDPAFSSAVSALKAGELSAVVKTATAFHIIKVLSIEPGHTQTFDEVKASILSELKSKEADDQFYAALPELQNGAFDAGSLQALADDMDLGVQTTASFDRKSVPAKLNSGNILNVIFDDEFIADDKNSSAIEVAPQSFLVVKVSKHMPAAVKPLASIKPQVTADYLKSESVKAAELFAQELVTELKAGNDISDKLATLSLSFSETKSVKRFDKSTDPALNDTLFTMAKPVTGSSVKQTQLASGELAVVELIAVIDTQANTELADVVGMDQIAEQQAASSFQALLAYLNAQAEVSVSEKSIAAQQ